MRRPDAGPLGETSFEARVLAMVAALRVNRPGGGYVETVVTPAIQRCFLRLMTGLYDGTFFPAVGTRVK